MTNVKLPRKPKDITKCLANVSTFLVNEWDYDKKNCHPSNLITVCGPCNIRANIDRGWHTEWYQTIMNKKFGYIY